MDRIKSALLLSLLAFTTASHAFAWGCDGHQIVAMVAERLLPPAKLDKINALLAANPGPAIPSRFCDVSGLSPIEDASTWADDYRDIDHSTGNLHFIDIPLSLKQPSDLAAYCKNGCVVDAIRQNRQRFQSANNDADRATALRFLIHFVGDAHQPLHAGDNNDHGGNCVGVQYFSKKPQMKLPSESVSPNLHGIWDGDLLRTYMGEHDLSDEQVATRLTERFRTRLAGWRSIKDPAAWSVESFRQARAFAYGALPVPIQFEQPIVTRTCADDNHIAQRMLQLNEQLGQDYENEVIGSVQAQLAKAGVRLAELLDQIVQ